MGQRGSRTATTCLVAAPHPDDEVIGTGGIPKFLSSAGVELCILAVTDGESSHSFSTSISRAALRVRRCHERAAALRVLGVTAELRRAQFSDGAVTAYADTLAAVLGEMIDSTTTVIAPWRHDGHADHQATSRAARQACRRTGAALWEVPIWAKVDQASTARCETSRSALLLSPSMAARKRVAVGCFGSQLEPVGDGPFDGPVVHPNELDDMLNGREELWW